MNIDFGWLPWLLLGALAFFAAGWFVARIDLKQLLTESRALPQSYFRGLNFLLNEQPDKAIESFLEVTKANPEAIELQFALGSLFRRRGEVDRAIRVHQDLSERANASAEQRTAALLELAQDYQKAGLLEHAERILADLSRKSAGSEPQQAEALKQLLDIYVQEKRWELAIDAAERLKAGAASESPSTGSTSASRPADRYAREIAHYYCEWADDAQRQGDAAAANTHLDSALRANPKCVRANLTRGSWQAGVQQHVEAIATWHQIESQDPAYLGLAADRLLQSHEAIGQGEKGLEDLRELQQHYPALDLLNAIFTATLKADGPQAAYELVKNDLRANPTLVGLDRLLEAQVLAAPEERKQDLTMLKELVHSHSSRLAVYLCSRCGFKAKQFYWHCPACGGWETFPPRRTAEYESADRHLARSQVEG
jgi:lipopolysaccharide assembly protein B